MTALQNMRNAESAFGPLRTSNQGYFFFWAALLRP